MEWSWEVAFDVLPQLASGLIVTVEATFVGAFIAYLLGLVIAVLRMSRSKIVRVTVYWNAEFIRRTPLLSDGPRRHPLLWAARPFKERTRAQVSTREGAQHGRTVLNATTAALRAEARARVGISSPNPCRRRRHRHRG